MIHEFGPFSLDPRERVLRRHGELVPLTPKVFDILLVLVQKSGHVLTKSEMMQLVCNPIDARKADVKALELDPSLGEAHASLGFLTFLHDWDSRKAEAELQRAIELNPNYAQAHQWYAIYLAKMG